MAFLHSRESFVLIDDVHAISSFFVLLSDLFLEDEDGKDALLLPFGFSLPLQPSSALSFGSTYFSRVDDAHLLEHFFLRVAIHRKHL